MEPGVFKAGVSALRAQHLLPLLLFKKATQSITVPLLSLGLCQSSSYLTERPATMQRSSPRSISLHTRRHSGNHGSFHPIPEWLKSLADCLQEVDQDLVIVDGAFQQRLRYFFNDSFYKSGDSFYSQHAEVAEAISDVRAFTETLCANFLGLRQYLEGEKVNTERKPKQARARPQLQAREAVISLCQTARPNLCELSAQLGLFNAKAKPNRDTLSEPPKKRRRVAAMPQVEDVLGTRILQLRSQLVKVIGTFDSVGDWGRSW